MLCLKWYSPFTTPLIPLVSRKHRLMAELEGNTPVKDDSFKRE